MELSDLLKAIDTLKSFGFSIPNPSPSGAIVDTARTIHIAEAGNTTIPQHGAAEIQPDTLGMNANAVEIAIPANNDNNNAQQQTEDGIPVGANPNSHAQEETTTNQVPATTHPSLSFADVMLGEMRGVIPLRERNMPRIIGGKVAVAIDENEYMKSIQQF